MNQTTGQQIYLKSLRQPGLYGCAQQEMPVQLGHRYQLLTVLPTHDTLRSSCELPLRAAKIDSVAFGEPYSDTFDDRRRVTLSWQDVSTDDNSYRYFIVSQYMFNNFMLVDTYFDQQMITQAGQRLYFNNDVIDSATP
ncbi:hypothetical protein GCM10028807_02800 [Spirosoma daeguense]